MNIKDIFIIIFISTSLQLQSKEVFVGQPTPTAEEIINAIPFLQEGVHEKANKMLNPYFKLIAVDEICKAFTESSRIEKLHPGQKWGSAYDGQPAYEENRAYCNLAAIIYFWWCNIKQSTSLEDQLKFIKKQDAMFQKFWIEIVANSKLNISRDIGLACLDADIDSSYICISMHKYKEWWGDPAKLFDIQRCIKWTTESKLCLLEVVKYSSDDEFKRKIRDAFKNDEDEMIRDRIKKLIKDKVLPSL